MNLLAFTSTLEKLAPLSLTSQHCLKAISPLATCQACEDICPHQALAYSDSQWHIDTTLCTNCGLCIAVCPTSVFALEQSFLLDQALTNDHLQLSCYHFSLVPPQSQQINCYHQLSPELIFKLLATTQTLTLLIDDQHCQKCPNHWFSSGLLTQLQQFGLPLDNLKLVPLTAVQPKPQTHTNNSETNTSRRSFFQQLFQNTKQTSIQSLATSIDHLLNHNEPVPTPTPQPKQLVSKRQWLLPAYQTNKHTLPLDQQLPYRQLQVDHCTFCGACVQLCPTKCLTLSTHDDEHSVLAYDATHCIKCNLCQNVCFQKQLYWGDYLTLQSFLHDKIPIAQSDKRICSQCQHDFWDNNPAATSCAFCH